MTKADIVKRIKERTGLSRQQSVNAVEIVLKCIKDSLKREERVCLVGLGSFYVKHRKQRQGRNPKTGEKITVPEKKIVVFRAGREFRELAKEAKQSVTIKGSKKLKKGFRIGKKGEESYIDFTDEALAEAFRKYLNPKLVEKLDIGLQISKE